MTAAIEIENLGPVARAEIPLPAGGGVVVLRGTHGTGKSHILRGVSRAMGGSAKSLSAHDGAQRGSVVIGDAKLTVTRARTQRRGELEVSAIESRLDISKLVDPQIDDEDRADAARIKALVSLAGVKADPSQYYDLVCGREAFDLLGVDTDTDDPIVLASRVKKSIEQQARLAESTADTETGHANAAAESIDGLDFSRPSDSRELSQQYDEARDKYSKLVQRRESSEKSQAAKDAARRSLAEAKERYDGKTVEQANSARSETHGRLNDAIAAKNAAEQALLEAKSRLAKCQEQHNLATADLKRAEDHKRAIEGWTATIESADSMPPSVDELHEAKREVELAREAMEYGVKLRSGLEQKFKLDEHRRKAKEAKRAASRLRDAARSTDDVLSSLVPGRVLRVEAGRLVTSTDRSKSELYADLSHGERWKIAIDMATDQLDQDGVLVIPQEAWEGLNDEVRAEINAHAKQRGVVILTAEVSTGKLEAVEA